MADSDKPRRRFYPELIQNLLLLLLGVWLRRRDGHVQTFQQAGILDRHARGVVLRLGDSEFQIEVKQSR